MVTNFCFWNPHKLSYEWSSHIGNHIGGKKNWMESTIQKKNIFGWRLVQLLHKEWFGERKFTVEFTLSRASGTSSDRTTWADNQEWQSSSNWFQTLYCAGWRSNETQSTSPREVCWESTPWIRRRGISASPSSQPQRSLLCVSFPRVLISLSELPECLKGVDAV